MPRCVACWRASWTGPVARWIARCATRSARSSTDAPRRSGSRTFPPSRGPSILGPLRGVAAKRQPFYRLGVLMQARAARPVYDVCIVGSGAGGGTAAYALTRAGARVVMLEAGREWFASKNSQMLTPTYASPRRGASTRTRPFGEFDACDGGWDIEGEPYTTAEGSKFLWWRARMLGGRTNHWGRISLRFGPDDFKGKSKDGLGDDWPISYDDVAPYYDRVD